MQKIFSLALVLLAFACSNDQVERSSLMDNGTTAVIEVCNQESETLYLALAVDYDQPTATIQGWQSISPGGCSSLPKWKPIDVIKQAFYVQSARGRYIASGGDVAPTNQSLICVPNGISLGQDFSSGYNALNAFNSGYCPGSMIKKYLTTLGAYASDVSDTTYFYRWKLKGGRYIDSDRLVSTPSSPTEPTKEQLKAEIASLTLNLEKLKGKVADCDSRVQSLVTSGRILGTPIAKVDELKGFCNFEANEHADLMKKFQEAKTKAKETLSTLLTFLQNFYDKLTILGPRVNVVAPYADDYAAADVSNLVRPKADADLAAAPQGFFSRIGAKYREILGGFYGQYTDRFVASALAFTSTFYSYGSEMLPGEDMDQGRFLEYKAAVDSFEEYFNSLDYEKDKYGYPLDSPVPDDVKLAVRDYIKPNAGTAGADLENALKQWEGTLTEKQRSILEAVRYLGLAFQQTVLNLPGELAAINKRLASITEGAVKAVKDFSVCAAKVGAAGDFGDWYEVTVGKDLCTGEEITPAGRVFSAAGLVVGSAKFWRVMGGVAGVVVTKRVFKEIEVLSETVIDIIGLSEFKRIKDLPKSSRPDPSTYLPKAYIEKHLAQFDDGASRFTIKSKFDEFGPAQRDKTSFILPKSQADQLLANAKGDIREIEKALGLEKGTLDKDVLIRIDVPKPQKVKLRVPRGSEDGANSQWLPGGKLPTGLSEAVVDLGGLPMGPDTWIFSFVKF